MLNLFIFNERRVSYIIFGFEVFPMFLFKKVCPSKNEGVVCQSIGANEVNTILILYNKIYIFLLNDNLFASSFMIVDCKKF